MQAQVRVLSGAVITLNRKKTVMGGWNAECKCGKQNNIDDGEDIDRKKANEIFRDRGWLIADNSEQEGACVCPGCQPK